MMKMLVMIDVEDQRSKEKIIRSVASCSGITTITMDANDGKLTVIGNFEILKVLPKLTRKWSNATLVAYGPYDPKKEAESAAAAAKKKKEESEREAMHALHTYQHANPYVHHFTTVYDHDLSNACVIL